MSHTNKIIDSDAFFEVNAITRQIANKTPSKITLMQNDHNSERFTFSVPRFIEGHDILEVDRAEVHYLNGEIPGMYEMKDLAVDPKDESKVVCSWLLTNNATTKADSLIFLLKFICFADDGITVDYAWHTALFSGINISVGLNNSGTVAEDNVDVLEQWRQEFIQKEEKNVAGGVAGLDENGKIHADQIPAGSGGGGSITVDDKLDVSSTNPIQNKVVAETFHKIGEDLTSKISSIWSLQAAEDVHNILFSCIDGTSFVLTEEGTDEALNLVGRGYVDSAIGDIETALENIITKYGLGGEAE